MSDETTVSVKIGTKIDPKKLPPDGPLHNVGFEEVAHLLACGWAVTAIEPAAAVFIKTAEDDGYMQLVIAGFTSKVCLSKPDPATGGGPGRGG